MTKRLADLINVKTIVTFCVLAVWAVLSLSGCISADKVEDIAKMVIIFYFGTQVGKKEEST